MKENLRYPQNSSSQVQDIYFKRGDESINIMDIEPDPEILFLAREYDKKCSKRKNRIVKTVHVAALVLVCFVTISAISLESSSALRLRVFQLFFGEGDGSVTFFGQDEYDLIGEWKDYWYPTYLPEGFMLEAADRSESEKILLFSSENGDEIRIIEQSADTIMSTDTDYTSIEEVEIGCYRGYLLADTEYDFMQINWMTDDRQFCVNMIGALDKAVLMKVAENLEYKSK